MQLKSVLAVCLLSFATLSQLSLGQDIAPKAAQKEEAKVAQAPIVKLLEKGNAPRHTLRLLSKEGMKQSSMMTMKMDQSITMQGQKIPSVPTPAMNVTINAEVTDVAANGDIAIGFKYPKAQVVEDSKQPSPATEMLQTMLKSVEGLSGTATVTNRGITRASDIELPPNATPQITAMVNSMKESMNRISSPLPEEAIGVGGKWSVTQAVEINGMKISQTSIHTLKEMKGNIFDIAIELTQSAEPQEIKTPGIPPGTQMALKSLKSTGEGKVVFDSGAIFPTSEIKSDSQITMEMTTAGQTLSMQVEMTLGVNLGPAAETETNKSAEK